MSQWALFADAILFLQNPTSSDVLIVSLRLVKPLALSHSRYLLVPNHCHSLFLFFFLRIPSWGIDSTQDSPNEMMFAVVVLDVDGTELVLRVLVVVPEG